MILAQGIANVVQLSQIEVNLVMVCANAPGVAGLWKRLRADKRNIPRALRYGRPSREHHELGIRLETGVTPTQSTQAGLQRPSQDDLLKRPGPVYQITGRDAGNEGSHQ